MACSCIQNTAFKFVRSQSQKKVHLASASSFLSQMVSCWLSQDCHDDSYMTSLKFNKMRTLAVKHRLCDIAVVKAARRHFSRLLCFFPELSFGFTGA